MRLAAVFDDGQVVARRDARDRGHVGRLAVEVHRQDRAGARADALGNPIGIDGGALRIDVGEHRPCAGHHDRQRAVRRRQRRRDHFIAGADPERAQDQRDRVGARADADGVRGAGRGGEFLLEGGDFRPEHEPAARDHAIDRASHLAGVLARDQRHERDPVRAHGWTGSRWPA